MDDENEIRRKFAEFVEWLADRQDPHNFIIIPEFGVKPASVDWEGFALPLVHPKVQDRATARALRLALVAARAHIVKDFKSLAEVKQLADEVLLKPIRPISARHHAANSYMAIESGIRSAANERRSPEQRLKSVSEVLALVSSLRTYEEWTFPKRLAKSRASNGGKKSALIRGKEPIDMNALVANAKELGWPDKTYMVTKTLSRRFKRSTSFINKALAAARSNSI